MIYKVFPNSSIKALKTQVTSCDRRAGGRQSHVSRLANRDHRKCSQQFWTGFLFIVVEVPSFVMATNSSTN